MFVIPESSCDTEAFSLKLNDFVDWEVNRVLYDVSLADKQLFHLQNDAECDLQDTAVHLGTDVIKVGLSCSNDKRERQNHLYDRITVKTPL